MRIFDPNVHDGDDWSDAFFAESPSFEAWITAWASGVDLWDAMYGAEGHVARIISARYVEASTDNDLLRHRIKSHQVIFVEELESSLVRDNCKAELPLAGFVQRQAIAAAIVDPPFAAPALPALGACADRKRAIGANLPGIGSAGERLSDRERLASERRLQRLPFEARACSMRQRDIGARRRCRR
jgi:hypothetical protein